MNWPFTVLYLLGIVRFGTWMARRCREGQIRNYGLAYADRERTYAILVGYTLALAWPVWAPFAVLYDLSGGRLFRWITRTEIDAEREERATIERTAALAREYDLPNPGSER